MLSVGPDYILVNKIYVFHRLSKSPQLTWLLPMSWHAGIGLSHKLFGRHLTDETPIKLFPFVHSNWTLSLRPCLLDGVALRPSVSSISGQLTYNYQSVFIYRG